MRKDYKYKIGGNSTGTILGLFMLVLFGGITIWLYLSKNGAFLFGMILTVIMLLINLAALYNILFHKIFIGQSCLYYQTSPTNGKEYKYSEISEVRISSGKSLNGMESDYCNIRFTSGGDIKFPFFPDESEGIEYLMDRVDAYKAFEKEQPANDKNTVYYITGKFLGITRIVIASIMLVISVFLEIALFQNKMLRLIIPIGIVFTCAVLIYNLIRFFCLDVRIEEDGFYVRTGLFDGRYYNYTDIKKCKTVMKEYKHNRRGHGTQRMYYYFFVFTDRSDITRKIQFEKAVNGYEIGVLRERIIKANTEK